MFFKVAADLAGVKVTQKQIEAQQNYIASSAAAAEKMKSDQNAQNKNMTDYLNSGLMQELTPIEKIEIQRRKDN